MNNTTIITRLKDLQEKAYGNYFVCNGLQELIDDIKNEEVAKGYKPSEKERFKLALSIQEQMFKSYNRPILSLWNKNDADGKYYWTNAVIMVRLSEEDFFKELKTTDDTFKKINKKGDCYFGWQSDRKCDYPKVDSVWLKAHEEIEVDMRAFMSWLRANKTEEYVAMAVKDLTIYFNPKQIFNALVLSKVAQKDTATLKYLQNNMKPFQFDDNCLCTPLRPIACDKVADNLVFKIGG